MGSKAPGNSPSVISAFNEEQVERLIGVTKAQLRYWDRTGFFSPSLSEGFSRRTFGRVYSFRDLVSLRVLNELRNRCKIPLQHLREVKDKLASLGDDVWLKQTLYVHEKRVVVDSEDGKKDAVTNQGVLEIPLREVCRNLESKIQKEKRTSAEIGQISKKRNISHNKAVVAGTRVPVKSLKAFKEAGYSIKEILEEYPSLTKADVEAAIGYEESA